MRGFARVVGGRRRATGAVVLICALDFLCGRPAAAGNAAALLRRGDAAERTMRYSGTKVIRADCSGHVHQHPSYERSVRIWHGGPGRTRLEFLHCEGGTPRIVVENGAQRWFYSPLSGAWRPASWRTPQPRLDLLLKNYRVLPGQAKTIAGRRALRVRVEPRFPGNPRKEVWLDLATGIPLRSDLYDRRGHLVSTSEFVQFHPERSLSASLFRVPVTGGGQHGQAAILRRENAKEAKARKGNGREPPTPQQPEVRSFLHPFALSSLSRFRAKKEVTLSSSPARPLRFEPALPRYLPRGYVLDRVTRGEREGTAVIRARFTDGLNILSLVEWLGGSEPEVREQGRFWSPRERIQVSIGPIHVSLAGALEATVLRRIVRSIQAPRTGSGTVITRK